MSLVNYGSSDESSDEEVQQTQKISRPSNTHHDEAVESLKLPGRVEPKLPDNSSSGTPRENVVHEEQPVLKRSLLSTLPPPKSSKQVKGFPLKNQESDTFKETDSSTNIKKSFLNLPPPKKKSQTVKITVPSLPDPGSDEDEGEPPVAKKLALNKGVSGLLSLLPKPRCAMSSRILVPHTVSRKPQPSKPKPEIPKPKPESPKPQSQIKPAPKDTTNVIGADYDSDGNLDEEGSFFSLGASETTTIPQVPSTSKNVDKLDSKISLPLPPGTVNKDYLKTDSSDIGLSKSKSSVNTSNLPGSSYTLPEPSASNLEVITSIKTVSSSAPTVSVDANISSASDTDPNSEMNYSVSNNMNLSDAPLSFNKSHSSSAAGYGHVTSSYYSNYGYSGNYYQEGQSSYECNQTYEYNSQYQSYPDNAEGGNTQLANTQETNADDDEFRRFFGKKRGKEDITMININADDQTAGSNTREALLKSISEEKQPMSYSKKKNADLPSSQQRRKHQITYLAFQAKERELALKNQWSQNRLTRKQTQAKYGF